MALLVTTGAICAVRISKPHEQDGLSFIQPAIMGFLRSVPCLQRRNQVPKVIPLTQGRRAIVDDDDYEKLSQHLWYLHKTRSTAYAARYDYSGERRKLVYMHREILNPGGNHCVDHVNRYTLDNRRHNLRVVSTLVNNRNRRFS